MPSVVLVIIVVVGGGDQFVRLWCRTLNLYAKLIARGAKLLLMPAAFSVLGSTMREGTRFDVQTQRPWVCLLRCCSYMSDCLSLAACCRRCEGVRIHFSDLWNEFKRPIVVNKRLTISFCRIFVKLIENKLNHFKPVGTVRIVSCPATLYGEAVWVSRRWPSHHFVRLLFALFWNFFCSPAWCVVLFRLRDHRVTHNAETQKRLHVCVCVCVEGNSPQTGLPWSVGLRRPTRNDRHGMGQ